MSIVISSKDLAIINDGLANDDVSSDAELVQNFIENGVDDIVANTSIAFRDQILTDPFGKLEIEKGTLVFRTQRHKFNQ